MMQMEPAWIAAAQAAQTRWGILASVTLAQFGDESGWGKDMPPGSFNPFGIKARLDLNGHPIDPYVMSETGEVFGGKDVTIHAPFRRFANLAEAFSYHGCLLATVPRYADARKVRWNYAAFCNALTGTYATDPGYGPKLIRIIEGDQLHRYDLPPPAALAVSAPPRAPSPPPSAVKVAQGQTVEVTV